MIKNLIGIAFISMILFSCKKEQSQTQNTPAVTPSPKSVYDSNYYSLKTGSYWIYDCYTVDTLNNLTFIGQDSVWIKGDTVIRGYTYFIMTGQSFNPNLNTPLRDSSNWLVNSVGQKICNNIINTSIFFMQIDPGYDTVSWAMMPSTYPVTVPAGVFNCVDAHVTVKFNYSYLFGNPRHCDTYFAGDVGVVFETTFYATSPGYVEQQLVKYHLK